MMRNLLVTAHTGCNNSPPNTVESVLAGTQLGTDMNEIDIRSTADGIPILWHDDVLLTRTEGPLFVESLSYADILKLESEQEILFDHPKAKITKLHDILDAIEDSGIDLNLDLKDNECIVPVAKLVKSRNLAHRVIFSGCEKVRASYLKSNNSEFQVLLNADERIFHSDKYSHSEMIRTLCDTAVSAGCCGLNIHHQYCDDDLVEHATSRFLPVAVWTVNPEDNFGKYINMGVASITTLHVRELLEHLSNPVAR